jgi:hypothetical protein
MTDVTISAIRRSSTTCIGSSLPATSKDVASSSKSDASPNMVRAIAMRRRRQAIAARRFSCSAGGVAGEWLVRYHFRMRLDVGRDGVMGQAQTSESTRPDRRAGIDRPLPAGSAVGLILGLRSVAHAGQARPSDIKAPSG